MLTLGFSNGKTFLPLDFPLHHEPGKKKNRGLKKAELKAQFSKTREAATPSAERVAEVDRDKISTVLAMIARVIGKFGKVDYVLADSWFTCEKFIKKVKSFNKRVEVIGLMKANPKIKLGSKSHRADNIPEVKRKNIKYCRKLKCHYISLAISYRGIEMRGYWIKMKGQQNWRLLISTNRRIGFLKAMEIYQYRWSIEVFFRYCKQNLNLGHCQSRDFDAQIANTSIVMMNYMALALRKRLAGMKPLAGYLKNSRQ